MPEGWIIQAADTFWAAAPGFQSFPRDLAAAAPWALQVAVAAIPRLSIAAVRRHLDGLAIPHDLPRAERRLHGCCLAYAGHGLILLDAGDSADQQRYTAAHEVGHLIADYLEPRRRTVARVGRPTLEVLDGTRAATYAERFRAMLAGEQLQAHVHLMDRLGGEPDAESRADRLALELLAPEDDAIECLSTHPEVDPAMVLRAAYGLPARVAAQYVRWLVPPVAVTGAWLLRPSSARAQARAHSRTNAASNFGKESRNTIVGSTEQMDTPGRGRPR